MKVSSPVFTYHPQETFLDKMKKYEERTGKDAPFVPFVLPGQQLPYYDGMNKQQKAWYFYWRTEVRKQNYIDTDLSYIFLHLYEILNGFGWIDAAAGYAQIIDIWMAYRKRFPKLDNYLQKWTFDFAKFYDIDYSVPEEVKHLIPVQRTLRDLLIHKHCKDKPLNFSFALIDILCDYSVCHSDFYKAGHQQLLEEAVPRVISLVDAGLWKKSKKGILATYGPEKKKTLSYYAFRGALFGFDKQVKVSAKPYTETPQLRNCINEIVRHSENILREIYDYPGRLRNIVLDEDTSSLISCFLKKEYGIKGRKATSSSKDVFTEIAVSGKSEHIQKIPASTVSKSVVPGKNDDWDFNSSHSVYSSVERFMDDMKKYSNRIGRKVKSVPFMQYYPTYDSMNKHQEAWYFYWRTQVRKQNYIDTDFSYIFIHIYELLNGCGWSTASDGYDQLMNFWLAYRERFPKLDHYLADWIFDFTVLHNLEYRIPESINKMRPQSAMINVQIEQYSQEKLLKLPFFIIEALCDYSIRHSKFYRGGHQLLLEGAIPRVVTLADAALLKKTGKGILALYGPKEKQVQTYYAFHGAIYFGSDKQVSISVKPYTTTPKLCSYINEIVRHAENVLREINNHRGSLHGVTLEEETSSLISVFLKREYSVKKSEVAERVHREVSLDVDKINKLRTESDAVRKALEISEENVVKKPNLTDLKEVTALLKSVSADAGKFLRDLSQSAWRIKESSEKQLLVQEINRSAQKFLAQALLVVENNHFIVEDDYLDELEYIFANTPDIVSQDSDSSDSNLSKTQNIENIYFALSELSVPLRDAVSAMSDIQQKALRVIVIAESVQEQLQKIADEEMTMADILVDEINEVSSQYIDDILVDTLGDVPCILEQYEEELKKSVIQEKM